MKMNNGRQGETLLSPGQRMANLASFAIPVIILWILYHHVLGNWWLIDDPCHLFYISQNGIYPAFFDPARGFSSINFTPWEPLSLGIDYLVFGFNPLPFYWHHLLSLSKCNSAPIFVTIYCRIELISICRLCPAV
jgi:hypothetical protein